MSLTLAPDEILTSMLREQPKRLFRRALSLGLKQQEAEDAAQDVAIVALKKINTVARPNEATICSWIDTIARRMVVDFYRRQALDREASLTAVADESPADLVTAPVERELLVGAVIAAIRDLPPIPRKIVELRFFKDMSTIEIAAELGMSDAAVRQRLTRARTALAAAFE